MTIRRADEAILLEGVCAVEEAETMMYELQAGATLIDWSNCSHLHTACLQVILAAGVATVGMPENPALARCLAQLMPAAESRNTAAAESNETHPAEWIAAAERETACLTEA